MCACKPWHAVDAPRLDVVPTDLEIGRLGPERSVHAWRFVRDSYLRNPLPLADRVAYLCAAWERPGGRAASVHASGISLLGQGPELIDLAATWKAMADAPAIRRVLRATMDLGQGHVVPPQMLEAVHATLGPWTGAWQDLLALAGWYDLVHRANLWSGFVHSDPRLEDWLARVVEAGRYLPKNYE